MDKKDNGANKKNEQILGMEDLYRFISEQGFETEEELQSFLERIQGQRLEEILPEAYTSSPQVQARNLLMEAMEAEDEARAYELLEQVEELDPDNVDVHLARAEWTDDVEAAILHVRKGLEAGKRQIDPGTFEAERGMFWMIPETRPYMYAALALADLLWMAGQEEEAMQWYRELLELNFNDNQGVRYILAVRLLESGHLEEFEALLAKFPDEAGTAWLYTKALFLFLKEGNSIQAIRAIQEARDANPHVIDMLVNDEPIPESIPMALQMGSAEEAHYYLMEAGHLWIFTEGAIDWLEKFVK